MGRRRKRKKYPKEVQRLKVRHGIELENNVAKWYAIQGFLTYVRINNGKIDVLAINPSQTLCFVIECKNYSLNKKRQIQAVRQLNRNFPIAIEFLKNRGWRVPKIIKKVLVARQFAHFSKDFLHYTTKEIKDGIKNKKVYSC